MRFPNHIIFLLLLFGADAFGSEYRRYKMEGFAALDSNNFAGAQACFRKAYAEADLAIFKQEMDGLLAYCAISQNHPEEAMSHLHRAVQDGFISTEDLLKNESFNGLHNRADFQQLVARMRQQTEVQTPVFFLGLYQGALWLMAFFIFLLWFGTRERAYLWLGISIFWWIQFHLFQRDSLGTFYGQIRILNKWVSITEGQFFFTVALFMSCHFLFLKRLLDIQKRDRAHKILVFLCWFYPLSTLVYRLNTEFFKVLSRQEWYVMGILVGCALVVQSARQKKPGSGVFLLSYLVFLTGSMLSLGYSRGLPGLGRGPGLGDLTWTEAGGFLFFTTQALAVGARMNQLRKERKQAQIEAMKQLEEKVQERTYDLNQAKQTVEHQHQEILDSIEYAKRIQGALLPGPKIIKEYLADSFLLYLPKDVVAGDFYWMERKGPWLWFAVCDCTGHGVPGAMVSVVCHNALNRAVNEFDCTLPGEILDKVAELVLDNFSNDQDVKDGMDASLCAWNLDTQTLYWAGANNPLWVIGKQGLIAHKPDKQAIGQIDDRVPYTTHKLNLETGDKLYLFTDGFADQFGGTKGKKLMRANFQDWLLELANKNMEEQRKTLLERHLAYRGNLPQVDDVCVMGLQWK